jgi:PleD family two-component response regulator
MDQMNKQFNDGFAAHHAGQHAGTIVLFSTDIDFCMSLRMLWQNQYKVVTITDPEMLLTTVRAFQPDLLIADATPSDRMRQRFEIMKKENAHLHIILLYAPKISNVGLQKEIRKSIDYMFSQPIDVSEVAASIEEALHHVN